MKASWKILIAALCAIGASCAPAQPADAGPLKVVVGFPAGGPPDIVARRIASRLAENTGRVVTVENRPGASGTIAASAVAHAPADGNTLLFGVAANLAVAPATMSPPPYDATRAFTPIIEVARGAYVLLVRADAPAANFAEFRNWGRANPGKLNYGSPGTGSLHHLALELLKDSQNLQILHVPYRSSLYPPLLSGDIQVIFDSLPGPLQLMEAGKLRALGVTGPKRLPGLQDVPTLTELGVPGMEDVSSWWGFVGPADMPQATIEKLNRELTRAMSDPQLVATLQGWEINLSPGSPQDFGRLIAEENRRWKDVVKQLGPRVN